MFVIDSHSQLGEDVDGATKVTGSLPFADDLYLENMLYGKIVWSEYPHAELLLVETKSAKTVAGVAAVLTAKDVPGLNAVGSLKADKPVLCSDRVRFMGDMVAVVFAETPAQAELAAGLVKVSYRELPGVFSLMKPYNRMHLSSIHRVKSVIN